MALEYALIVVGRASVSEMRARLDVSADAPFGVSLRRGKRGYFESGAWTLEPDTYLQVGFRVDKEADPRNVARSLVDVVERALAGGEEDIAFIQNGDVLVLERVGGEVRRLRVGFWDNL